MAQKYLDYLESTDGQMQRKILGDAILTTLPNIRTVRVLDAACGSGWLTYELTKRFDQVQGFDNSEFLLHRAKQIYPEINISQADATTNLPFPDDYFDIAILNMAASDVDDLIKLYRNLARVIKKNGMLLVTVPNPSYAYPVGVWKRNLWGKLFNLKPTLRIRPWNKVASKKMSWDKSYSGYFYPLSEQTKNANQAGFALTQLQEVRSETDSKEFNLQYQLYRYPLFVLLDFRKISEVDQTRNSNIENQNKF